MAVYTPIDDKAASIITERYGLGRDCSFHGITQGVENTNYRIENGETNYIFTIYEKRVEIRDLPFFMGLMQHLSSNGFPAPEPVLTRDNASIIAIMGKPASIVTFLDGQARDEVTVPMCAALGRTMARLHQIAASFNLTRRNGLAIPTLHNVYEPSRDRADEVSSGLAALIDRELAFIQSHWPDHLPKGVIHADLFPDNVFFRGDDISGVIDFYFACSEQLAYELAICLNAWCFDDERHFNPDKARAMFEGYQAIRTLSLAEIEAMPLLARGAAMRFLLTRLHDWLYQIEGAQVRPKDPREYLHKLDFHRQVAAPSDYGIEPAASLPNQQPDQQAVQQAVQIEPQTNPAPGPNRL